MSGKPSSSRRRPAGRKPARTSDSTGFNAHDPGVEMLVRAAEGVPQDRILLVATGNLPRLDDAARVVLDVREQHPRGVPWVAPGTIAPQVAVWPVPKTLALVWPRAHLGKDFMQQCLALAGLGVEAEGAVLCAVRKQKGADSVASFMAELFGMVDTVERDRGYRLFRSERGARFDETAAHELLALHYEVHDPVLGDLVVRTAPGVFARQKLDAGTRALIEYVRGSPPSAPPRRVLDLCAGVAPLASWAASTWPTCRALAVESNLLAVELARHNVASAGLSARVEVVPHDGLPPLEACRAWAGAVDLALINPPTHADPAELRALLLPLREWLAPEGRAFLVAHRGEQIVGALGSDAFATAIHRVEGYSIVELCAHA